MPPIRLKLSLSSAAPLTPSPAPTLPTASRKGKEKATNHEDVQISSTPTIRLRLPDSIPSERSRKRDPETPLARPLLKVKAPRTQPAERPTNGDTPHADSAHSSPDSLGVSSSLAGPSTTSAVPPTPSAVTSTPSATPRHLQSATKRTTKPKPIGKSAKAKPTSLLQHALVNPSTPQQASARPANSTPDSTSVPWTPSEQSDDISTPAVKIEREENDNTVDSKSPSMSRDQSVLDDPSGSVPPDPAADFEDSIDISSELLPKRATRARTGIKWMRIKRPLKDLLGKIMIELRRKDEYALFDEPVNPDNFPGYLEVVGGEDKMMDLGTMQSKIDDGLYKTIDELESDLRLLAAAATSFNPPGTIPHTSANRLLAHGLKHIERARPIILTPSPSPDRRGTSEVGTPWRNGREATAATDEGQAISSVPPQSYIPEEMLLYPPNSAQALAVGWNLTGGKRVYAKRLIRGREKFNGKWRHWSEDGSRDLAELEEPTELLREWQASRDPRRVVDWKGLRKDGAWWEFELGGPAGQPPIAFTPFPRPDALRTRTLGAFEWGVYPEMEAEIAVLRSRNPEPIDEYGILERHLSTKARPPPPKNLIDIYDEDVAKISGDYVRTMCAGDLQGEAYIRSVNAFVRGAMESAQKTGVPNGDDHHMPLDEYVSRHHRGGILQHPTIAASDEAMAKLQERPLDPAVNSIASRTYAATALHQLTDASNPLDIVPFLREPKDFNHAGLAGKSGVQTALDGTAAEIVRLAEEIQAERDKATKVKPVQGLEIKKSELEVASRESSPLSAAPDSPKPTVVETTPIKVKVEDTNLSREEAMTKLRLELVALTKFYPLAALKRMTPAEAERLLPLNVRHLMCRPPKV